MPDLNTPTTKPPGPATGTADPEPEGSRRDV